MDLYVLERAFKSTHPASEEIVSLLFSLFFASSKRLSTSGTWTKRNPFLHSLSFLQFAEVLSAYESSSKNAKAVLRRYDIVVTRGRKKIAFG